MLELLAQTADPAPSVPWFANPMVLIIGLVAIWWMLVIGPQRKQEKSRKAKIEAIKKGDKVLTRAGIVGTVARVKDEVVIVRIDLDGKVQVPFQKGAIEDVLSGEGG